MRFSGWVSLPSRGTSQARGGCWPEAAVDGVTVVVLSSSADELGVNEAPPFPSPGDCTFVPRALETIAPESLWPF